MTKRILILITAVASTITFMWAIDSSVADPAAHPSSTTAPSSTVPQTTTTTADLSWMNTTTTTSTAIPTPATTVPAAPVTGCYADTARNIGWPEEAIGHLQHIITRESGCNPSSLADRPSTLDNSFGLLQINTYGSLWAGVQRLCGVTSREQLFDPNVNLSCGLVYYHTMGWNPWGG